jgi:glycosyltransferase involved in cell wall biosynthesis
VKILALVTHPVIGASSRHRIYQYVAPLEASGIHVQVHALVSKNMYESMFTHKNFGFRYFLLLIYQLLYRFFLVLFGDYDLIIVHREVFPKFHSQIHHLFSILAKKPFIFDFDDAVFTDYSIESLIQKAAAISSGNHFLADYVISKNPNAKIVVIPTVVDTDSYFLNSTRKSDEQLVVGWIGTESTYKRYLQPKLKIVVEEAKRNNAIVAVIGSLGIKKDVLDRGAVFYLWSLETEKKDISLFDIGIMPLQDDVFTRGKCAFKLIEYAASGIPGIGSRIGANIDVIKHGETGFLVDDDDELKSAIHTLLTDQDLRLKMGAANRKWAVGYFSLQSQVPVWINLIRSLAVHSKSESSPKILE